MHDRRWTGRDAVDRASLVPLTSSWKIYWTEVIDDCSFKIYEAQETMVPPVRRANGSRIDFLVVGTLSGKP
jgi:hypothetical protein